jgi:hypothetical protein
MNRRRTFVSVLSWSSRPQELSACFTQTDMESRTHSHVQTGRVFLRGESAVCTGVASLINSVE